MFALRTRGLLDFLVAAMCLWAAAYHTPAGALARSLLGWALGSKASSRPLLAYYSGGVYSAEEVREATVLPPPPLSRLPPELASVGPVGLGAHAVYRQLDPPARRPGEELARRLGIEPATLLDDGFGPAHTARLLGRLAAELGSEDAAVLALYAGYEPARYARDRAQAEGAAATLPVLVRHLPPGFEEAVSRTSQAMTLGTAYALSWPVPESTPITSPFGVREHPILGVSRMHIGVDLGVPEGSRVQSVAAGVVRRASSDAVNGRVLVVDHGRGVTTAYCHNSELLVRVGQAVRAGELIALSGNTGRSTGPHLHYQLELGRRPMDPLLFRAPAARAPLPPSPKVTPAGLRAKAAGPSPALRDAFMRVTEAEGPPGPDGGGR